MCVDSISGNSVIFSDWNIEYYSVYGIFKMLMDLSIE